MNRLKELRKEKKLTQEELASEIGVSKITILRWENGERQIKPDKAQALADYFGVSVGYLLGYDVVLKSIENKTDGDDLLSVLNHRRKMEKQIIIFLKNGETLLFQDVSNMDVTDKHIAFDYFGKSTNQEKSGAFFFDTIAGWSASAQLFK